MIRRSTRLVLGTTLAIAAVLHAQAQQQTIPRPEYPQPQFQRADWRSLNGQWEFDYDDTDQGLLQNWAAGGNNTRKFTRKIIVPFAPETRLSGIGDPSFHPVVWYRKALEIPAAWKGRRVLLHFGAVDYRARVWLNGREVGSHEGGHVPFKFDITAYLNASGPNTLVLRAEDPPTDRFIPRGKQYWELKSRGIFYTRTTGIWQPVWMEATGESWLERVRVTPTNDGQIRFEATLQRPDPQVQFHATVREGDRHLAYAMGTSDGPRASAAALIRNPKLWSPGQPNLYDVTFELRKGTQVLDRVESYFGFRSVVVGKDRLLLNGRPTYLKMVLDQGYWPESTLTPPSDEAIQYDIRLTKEMGFNGARKHQKLEDPRYLYWADKMGLLVSSEMANAYLYDDGYVARFTQEWTEAVQRDYNHPSIIMWIPINESWGVPDLNDRKQQQHLRSMYTLTHSLDGTRPVIDNDGWEHTEMTDLFGIHDYTAFGDSLYEKYKRLGEPNFGVPDNARAALAPGNRYNGSPVFLSEFGGVSYLMPGQQAPEGSWGYSGLMKDQGSAFQRMATLWNAIGKIQAIAGICYTQLTDVEQEVNGLLTYDRKPKFNVKELSALNEQLR